MRRTDGRDRTLVALLALLPLGVGVAGLCAANGVFGAALAHRPVFDNVAARWVGTHGGWVWWVFAAVSLLLALLGLLWLRAQVRTDRVTSMNVASAPGGGGTTLQANAVTDAVSRQLEAVHGIESATARMLGTPDAPRLDLVVAVSSRVGLGAVRERVEVAAVADVRRSLSDPDLPVAVRYEIRTPRRDR